VPCSPCGYHVCPIDHPCLSGISAATVLEVAGRLLEQERLLCAV
jgi:hypothetical protein